MERTQWNAQVKLSRNGNTVVVRKLRCPCCRSELSIRPGAISGLRFEYTTGGVVIYYGDQPVHSCDLERAQEAQRSA